MHRRSRCIAYTHNIRLHLLRVHGRLHLHHLRRSGRSRHQEEHPVQRSHFRRPPLRPDHHLRNLRIQLLTIRAVAVVCPCCPPRRELGPPADAHSEQERDDVLGHDPPAVEEQPGPLPAGREGGTAGRPPGAAGSRRQHPHGGAGRQRQDTSGVHYRRSPSQSHQLTRGIRRLGDARHVDK